MRDLCRRICGIVICVLVVVVLVLLFIAGAISTYADGANVDPDQVVKEIICGIRCKLEGGDTPDRFDCCYDACLGK